MKITKLVAIRLAILISVFFAIPAYAANSIECDTNTCIELGNEYLSTDKVELAAKAYEKGCELGDSFTCYTIASFYSDGEIGEPNFSKAAPFYKKGCELLDSDACTDLADEYDDLEDYTNALVYYDKACELNDGYGCRRQAWILDNDVTPQDLKLATALYAKGCKLEDGWSCNNLGFDYMGYDDKPNPYVKKDYTKGIELMTLACNNYEIGSACTSLSHAYEEGHGVKQNFAESLRYSIKACDNDYETGCYTAGQDYEYGNGTKKDIKKAQTYYEKGCDLDNSTSCWHAAIYYDSGKGRRIKQSREKAKNFHERACELGDEDSCEAISE